jgi:hypothetical protein
MSSPIEHVYVFQLRWSELSSLSASEKAALSILSFVVSELNVLKRLALYSMFPHDEKSDVAPVISIQRNFILRTTTAKLFEFLRFIEKRLEDDNTSEHLASVLKSFEGELKKFKEGVGFAVAKQIRNKMANHLDFKEAISSVEAANPSVNCNFYLTTASGNSYYPMGDEIIFATGLQKKLTECGEPMPLTDALDAWIDWTLSLSELAERVHLELFKKLIEPLFPSRMAHHRPQWLSEGLVAKHPGFALPIFIRTTP